MKSENVINSYSQ